MFQSKTPQRLRPKSTPTQQTWPLRGNRVSEMCRSDISGPERVWFSNILNSPFSFRFCPGPGECITLLDTSLTHVPPAPRDGTGLRHFGGGRKGGNIFFTPSSDFGKEKVYRSSHIGFHFRSLPSTFLFISHESYEQFFLCVRYLITELYRPTECWYSYIFIVLSEESFSKKLIHGHISFSDFFSSKLGVLECLLIDTIQIKRKKRSQVLIPLNTLHNFLFNLAPEVRRLGLFPLTRDFSPRLLAGRACVKNSLAFLMAIAGEK